LDFSKQHLQDSEFGGWIYLKTRTSFDVVGDDDWSYAAFGRLDKESREKTQRKVASFSVYNIDLSFSQGRNPETLMDNNERRKFLVEGRKKATQALPRILSWLKEK
jgi:hypothetical protein